MIEDFTEIFCFVDDFLKEYDKINIAINNCKSKPGPKGNLNRSEVITIILGHAFSNFDCFKNYYEKHIIPNHNKDFKLVSYKRFNRLIKDYLPYFTVLLNCLMDECDGLSLVDSTSIAVCKNYRIKSHKVFDRLATRGKTTKGWFYGFKLHLITNLKGGIVKASFSPGNKDDRAHLKTMTSGIFGKIFGDRGYISKTLSAEFSQVGIQIVTRIKKNMKNILIPMIDKILLLKRCLIESVFSRIKLLNKFEHSRHRSPTNAFVHMIACLVNYQLLNNKPSIDNLVKIY